MLEQVIVAGFGGQGVLRLGQLMAYAGMLEGKEVSWLPSYGPEMRGGTANCNVMLSDIPVGSPIVNAGHASSVLTLNRPATDKFEEFVAPGGNLIINSSLVDRKAKREDVNTFYVPANDIAMEIGNIKVINVVMLGAYVEVSGILKIESVIQAMREVFGAKAEKLIPINIKALEMGAEAVKK